MMVREDNLLLAWLRRMLLGDRLESSTAEVERLRREIDDLRRQTEQMRQVVADPATVRPLLAEVLRQECSAEPSRFAAALRPVVEDCLSRREASLKLRRSRRSLGWLSAGAALFTVALVLVIGRANVTRVIEAKDAVARESVREALAPQAVTIQEQKGGFGLGEASRSDADLVRQVRARLSSCRELFGSRVALSVADGWVWLRGTSTPAGRAAADRALADLGDGVFVVNQLEVAAPASAASLAAPRPEG